MKLTTEELKKIQAHFEWEVEDKGWGTTTLRFDYWKRVDICKLARVIKQVLGDGIAIIEDWDWDEDCGDLFSYSIKSNK